jgi:hypothetical protein
MDLNKVHKWEKATVLILNLDGWDLEWCGGAYEFYDAKGKTPKGLDCVIEMKFRKTYYETKMLEKAKYERLMQLPEDVLKFYFVNDPKGNYLFWLNEIKMPETDALYCPDTTMWTKKRMDKEVYLLQESQATIINLNE